VVGADRCVRRHRCLLTIASIFIAQALDKPLSISEQISVLVFLIIASRAAAGGDRRRPGGPRGRPAGASPDFVDDVGLVVGIDRFMSEARALTNFAGNAVATVIIGKWVVSSTAPRRPICSTTRNPSTKLRCSTTSSRRRDHHLKPPGQVSPNHTTPAPRCLQTAAARANTAPPA
jgi:aerobic C4-dicarboxylate transport protein